MKLKVLNYIVIIFPFISSCFADDTIFNQANILRQAIINEDIEYLSTLDETNDLLTDQNKRYLFDPSWAKEFSPNKKSIKEIINTSDIATLIEQHKFSNKDVYYIYWIRKNSDGNLNIDDSHWLDSFAVCALSKSEDGNWQFSNHLCFSETEGPIMTGQ